MVYIYTGFIFILLLKLALGYTATCGSLQFKPETVTEGGVTTLIYKPLNIRASREWYRERPLTLLYDSGKSNNNTKYVEAAQEGTFTLSIKGVVQADAGDYIVNCGQHYSDRTTLTVTPQPTGESQTNCGSLTVKENNLKEGQTATLQFIIHPGRTIKWEKKINSTFQQLFRGNDYDITKYGEKTIHNLLIPLSEFSDSGEYRVNCDPAVSNSVHLNIVPTPPTVPEFSGNESIPECKECILAELNVSVNMECFVRGGTEPVVLNMFKDGNIISNVNKSITSKNGVNIYYARHIFLPSKMDFDVVFTCTVKNPALRVELVKSAPLYIRADPETVKIKVKQTTENEPSEIQCITKKGRPPSKSSIHIDNNTEDETEKTSEIKTENTYSVTTTVVKNFTRFDNQKRVMCCSNILNRICSNTSNVNVLFPPKTVSVKEIMKSNKDNGETELMLICSVEASNPRSSIEWKGVKKVPRTPKEKNYTNHSDTNGWTYFAIWMLNLTRQHNGHSITCEVKNPAFPDLELMQIYRLNITYNPVITISGQGNEVVYLGDDVLLTCNVDSNPPSTLAWHNQTDLIKETYGTNSLDLHIANITLNHSRIYTCTTHNNIGGTKTRSVSLTVKEKTFPRAVTGSSSISTIVPVVVGCTVVVVAAVIVIIVFVTCLKRRQNAQMEIKETKQRSTDPGRNDTNDANKAPAIYEDGANDQREYESVDPVKREETNEREETNAYSEPELDYDDVNVNLNTKFVRAKLDLKQASDNNDKSRSKVHQEATNVTVYVNTDQQQYESVLPTTDREEPHTYSKLGGDDGKTNLQSQGDVSLVLAELDLKRNSDNAVRKPLLVRDEPNNGTHYVKAKQPVYEGLEQKVDMEETHYSKLD